MLFVVATLLLLSCQPPQEITEEGPEASVSVDIIPKTKTIDPGGIITYKMDILNVGVGSLNVAVEHQLIEISSGKAISTKGEILRLQNQLILERGMPVPYTAAGFYQVKTVVSYADKIDTDKFEFEVTSPQIEQKEEEEQQQKSDEQKIQIIAGMLNQEIKQEELGPADAEITIDQWGFHPDEITITVGQIVQWMNKDTNSHTATGAGFDSGGIRRNAVFKNKFDQAGNYPYSDSYRPYTGVIHVRE